jgi:hypothetical protein
MLLQLGMIHFRAVQLKEARDDLVQTSDDVVIQVN